MAIIFLHIPKTAGTSVLTMMKNLFGDSQVLRFVGNFDNVDTEIANLANEGFKPYRFIAGHLPFSLFSPFVENIKILTFLRDPLQRLLSLYRFLRQRPAQELARLKLSTEFDIYELLDSKNPELYVQVNNGMCRQLSNKPQRANPLENMFWDNDSINDLFSEAYSTLLLADFGIVEDMGGNIDLLHQTWGVPFKLDIDHENQTENFGGESDPNIVKAIITANQADIKLYEQAKKLYQHRKNTLASFKPSTRIPEISPLNADANVVYPIGSIPCRQGFYAVESDGFAWIRQDKCGEFYFFVSKPGLKQVMFEMYSIADFYPKTELQLLFNDTPIDCKIIPGANPRCFQLVSYPVLIEEGLSKMAIGSSLLLQAPRPDNRKLGLAVFSMEISNNSQFV